MSIRLKLYMSYLAMTVVPVILLFLFIMIIFVSSGKQDIRDLTEAKQNENFNQALVYGELTYVLREDTGQMQNASFLADLQKRLSEQWAGLIIAKDGIVIEVSPFLKSLSEHEDWQQLANEPQRKLYF